MKRTPGRRKNSSGAAAVAVLLTLALFAPLALPAQGQVSREQQMQANEHLNKGNFYMGRRQFTEAIAEYEKAVDIDPGNKAAKNNIVLAHLNWGALHFAQKKYGDAMAEWETVLKLDPYNKSAKYNISVLKQTLARLGQELPEPFESQGAAAAKKEEPPPPAAMILTPGIKQSQPSAATAASPATGSEPQPTPAPTATTPAPAASSPAPARYSTPPASPAVAPSPAGGSIEDQLTAVEMKVYGHKQEQLTVMQRLEKLETDTSGQKRAGTIKDRIDHLKQTFGI